MSHLNNYRKGKVNFRFSYIREKYIRNIFIVSTVRWSCRLFSKKLFAVCISLFHQDGNNCWGKKHELPRGLNSLFTCDAEIIFIPGISPVNECTPLCVKLVVVLVHTDTSFLRGYDGVSSVSSSYQSLKILHKHLSHFPLESPRFVGNPNISLDCKSSV